MSGTLTALNERFETQEKQARALLERAAGEGRDLSEAESANADELKRSMTSLKAQIDNLADLDRMASETSEVMAQLPDRSAKPVERVKSDQITIVERGQGTMAGAQLDGPADLLRSIWPTPGDYLHDVIHGHQGNAESQGRLARALEHELTTDVPGLVPEPIVGDVVNIIDASRPATASLRMYGMPQYGSSFTRPKVIQHTAVGEQVTQKTELESQKMTVDPIQVSKMTLGGALNVSFQTIDWTQPAALNAITQDLADQYAIQTEATVATLLHTAAVTTNTANEVVIGATGTASAAQWIQGIADAAAAVYEGCKRMPSVIYASPDMWATLIGLTDTTGRPIVVPVAPTNAAGQTTGVGSFQASIMGLPLVVSPAFPAKTVIVAASQYAEAYEDRRGALRVVEPKLLGWEIAYYGYFASIVTESTAFVSIAVALI